MPLTQVQRTTAKVAAALLLFAAGWLARGAYQRLVARESGHLVRAGGFRFISPLLDVSLPEGVDVRQEPIPFKREVEGLVGDLTGAGLVGTMAVYYRDLADGPWFGINEEMRFSAASLMKVPVMVLWMKRAERDPAVLRRRMVFDERTYAGPPQATPPAKTLEDGVSYPVEELLERMLRYSDNRAAGLLFADLRSEEIEEVLTSMDATSEAGPQGNLVSAHGYSGFLRILYNAAYLNKAMSERALELLSHEDFPLGIVAGVPPGVVVASKFGEEVGPSSVELHEFGIVYHPRGPYLLGVMTRGRELARQAEAIRRVSAAVYAAVDSATPLRPAR